MTLAAQVYLAVTDSDPAPLNLMDRTTFRLPRQIAGLGSSGYVSRAGGTFTYPILCVGAVPTQGVQLLETKRVEAETGAGPWDMASAHLVLKLLFTGETQYIFVDVVDMSTQAVELYEPGAGPMGLLVSLACAPYGRGAAVTYGPFSFAAGGNAIWVANSIPGDAPALARIRFTDQCTGSKKIQRIRYGQHSHPLLASGDLNPYFTPTALSPGASVGDASARSGACSRLTPVTATWQSVCRVLSPTSGRTNRRARVFAKVRDNLAPAGAPTTAVALGAANSGNFGSGLYTLQVFPKDAFGNYGPPGPPMQVAVQLLSQGGGGPVAISFVFQDGFESGGFTNWPALQLSTNATATTSGAAAYAGSYGADLRAPSLTGQALLTYPLPVLTASRTFSMQARINIQSAPTTFVNYHPIMYIAAALSAGGAIQSVGLLSKDGTNWIAAGAANVNNYGSAPTTLSPNHALAAGWHLVELTCTLGPTDLQFKLTVDGVVWGGTTLANGTSPVGLEVGFQAWADNNSGISEFYVDNVVIADGYIGGATPSGGYSMVLTGTPGPNVGNHDLFYTNSTASVWFQVPNIGASPFPYTLTNQMPAGVLIGTSPPTALPPVQLSQVRAQTFAQAGGVPAEAVGQVTATCRLGGSKWEWLDLGGHNLPPSPARQGAAPPAWGIDIYASNVSTAGPTSTLDVDTVVIFDELRPRTELVGSPASTYVWDLDTRWDAEASALITDGSGNVQGEASVTAPFLLGTGGGAGTQLVPIVEVQDASGFAVGDAVNAVGSVSVTVVPRYLIGTGS